MNFMISLKKLQYSSYGIDMVINPWFMKIRPPLTCHHKYTPRNNQYITMSHKGTQCPSAECLYYISYIPPRHVISDS